MGSGKGESSTPFGVSWVSGITWGGGSWSVVRLKFLPVVGFAWTDWLWGGRGKGGGGVGVHDFGWGFLDWRIYMRWDVSGW